jgi:hypothetical protein
MTALKARVLENSIPELAKLDLSSVLLSSDVKHVSVNREITFKMFQ